MDDDEDMPDHPKTARRHDELNALFRWLDERGIEGELRGRIIELDVYLDRFDDRATRLHTVNQMDRAFRIGQNEWGRTGLRVIAVWRLRQQLLDE